MKRFVLCLGQRGDEIRDYVESLANPEWEIVCVNTGGETPTGGRIKRIQEYVKDEEQFLATYVDGLANIDIHALVKSAKELGTAATLTAVRPRSQYGILELDDRNCVKRFDEKPLMPHYINGGFFIFTQEVFKFLEENDVLEQEAFHKLIAEDQLSAYKHEGFWKSMDTFKENMELTAMWQGGTAEWRKW